MLSNHLWNLSLKLRLKEILPLPYRMHPLLLSTTDSTDKTFPIVIGWRAWVRINWKKKSSSWWIQCWIFPKYLKNKLYSSYTNTSTELKNKVLFPAYIWVQCNFDIKNWQAYSTKLKFETKYSKNISSSNNI